MAKAGRVSGKEKIGYDLKFLCGNYDGTDLMVKIWISA